MRNDFFRFLKAMLFFSVGAAAILFFLSATFLSPKIDVVSWLILGYFVLTTTFFHFGLLRSSKGKPQEFVRFYMGGTTLKLLLHIIVLFIYCLLNRTDASRFIMTFLIFYILFTVFETTVAAKKFRSK